MSARFPARIAAMMLLALAALVVCGVCGASPVPLHRPRIEANAAAVAAEGARIVFVEHAAAASVQVDAGADMEMESLAQAEVDAAAEAEAGTAVDLSSDPAGHSPFRVRRVEIEGEGPEAEAEASTDEDSAAVTSLLEQATPATHEISIPLTLSAAAPEERATVLMEVAARHRASADDHAAFIQMSEGDADSAEEMELDAMIEADAADAHDADLSMLELRSRDVPLYQEVLKEKHLATYYGALRIGDSLFRMLFDTGSCELWIPSDKCSTARCNRHKRFPEDVVLLSSGASSAVSSSKPSFFGKTRMNIEYISGKVSGPMIVSDVSVGGLRVPKQILGLARRLDIELLDDVVWDGIVGMAFPTRALTNKGVTPLFDNIIRQRLLSNARPKPLANQFAYYIDDTQGQMTFGGVNCAFVVAQSQSDEKDPVKRRAAIEQCKKSFQFVPVTRKTYWTLTLDDVTLEYPKGVAVPPGQKLSGHCSKYGCRAIVDTGTYLVYTSKFFRSPAAWAGFSHCGQTANLPNITFHFRGDGVRVREPGTAPAGSLVSLTLEPREYVLKFSQHAAGAAATAGAGLTRKQEDCVVGISPDKDAVFTLGQVFLRAYYALFDRDENRIGFSKIHRAPGHAAVNAKPSKKPPPSMHFNEGL